VLVIAGGVSLWPILAAAALGAAGLMALIDHRLHRAHRPAPAA